MRQEHHADRERAETELGRVHDLACPANRATAMANAELGGNDENVVTRLLVAELRELSLRLGELTQVLRTEATLTEVVELAVAGFRDQCEDPLDGFAIGRRNRLPARDGEPSLGPGRNRNVATFDVGRPEVREQRTSVPRLARQPAGPRSPTGSHSWRRSPRQRTGSRWRVLSPPP